MEVFVQQLINGITLGSIYGLIAIGYTMVFGIIGMVNFAHGDVFMVSAFVALITVLVLSTILGISSIFLTLFIVLIVAMLITSLLSWAIERVAYRPLRGSFRLAPLISAIGMSIFLMNFVQVAQGPRNKSIPPMVTDVFILMDRGNYTVTLSYRQLIIWSVTAILLAAFWYLVAKTPLGRAQRATEQDPKMAALLGVDVDRTISLTFVIGAALAAVAGTMYLMYYGVVSFADGFVPGIKAFTAAVLGGIGSLPGAVIGGLLIGLIETFWSAYFSIDYKDVAAFSILAIVLIFLPQGLLGRPEVEKVYMSEPVQARVDVPRAIREAAIAGLVAFGILLPLIGLQTTVNIRNELILNPRPVLLAVMVAAVIAISLLQSFVFKPLTARRAAARPDGASIKAAERRAKFSKVAIPFALGFAFLFPVMVVAMTGLSGAVKWVDNFGIQILIYIMLGLGLNIVVGLAGLLDLGYVAFYAVGAYSYALLAKTFGFSFWVLLPLAGILSAFWGILLGFPVLRLRGDYLAIVTLAFGEIIRLVLINWVDLTGGYAGISSIPRPTFFGIPFNANEDGFAARFGLEFTPVYRTIFLYYVVLCLVLLTAFVTTRLRRLPLGRAWEALREDEIACRALGIDTTKTKLSAFATGAMFGGFAGSFFAARQGFISPESFTFIESAMILAIVVLGGMGSQIGVAIAAIVMIGGTEIMRDLDFLKAIFGSGFDPTQYRMLLFGLAMVLIMIWKPRGLISTREPTAFLHERKTIAAKFVKEGRG